MSQQVNKITRSSSDVDKYGDLLDTKLDTKLLKFTYLLKVLSFQREDDVNEIKLRRLQDEDFCL